MRRIVLVMAALGVLSAGSPAFAAAKASDRQKACEDLAPLKQSVDNLTRLGADATVSQVKEAREQVRDSYERFSKQAHKVAEPQAKNLDASLKNLKDAVKNMSGDMTLQQNKQVITSAVDQVHSSAEQLEAALDCRGMAAPTP